MITKRKAVAFGLGVIMLTVVADLVTKHWLTRVLTEPQLRTITLTSFLNLVPLYNRGISFGLLGGGAALARWVFILLPLIVATALLVWIARAQRSYLSLALGLIAGGALGNAADRVAHGAVFDFIDVHYRVWHFWVFNLADSAITIGVALLLLDGLLTGAKPPLAVQDSKG